MEKRIFRKFRAIHKDDIFGFVLHEAENGEFCVHTKRLTDGTLHHGHYGCSYEGANRCFEAKVEDNVLFLADQFDSTAKAQCIISGEVLLIMKQDAYERMKRCMINPPAPKPRDNGYCLVVLPIELVEVHAA